MRNTGERPLRGEEQEFFRGLYQDHYRSLFRYACHLGIGREAAEDYVQDAFAAAIRHIEDIKKSTNPGRYLKQALKNAIGYRLRSMRYALKLQRMLQDGADRAQDEPYADALRPETLYGGSVSDADLRLLIRFYLEGWSQRELAQELGISEDACKMRIKRAKERLRTALEADGPPGQGGIPEERREQG